MYPRRLRVLLVVALLAAPSTGFAWRPAAGEPGATVTAGEHDAVPAVRSDSPLAGRLPAFADGQIPVGHLGCTRRLLAPAPVRAGVPRAAAVPRRLVRLRGATARGPPERHPS